MTKTKTNRRDSHNAKRASRFEAQGINAVTAKAITKAVATCEGYSEGDSCTLCDHAIKWLFRLSLTVGATDVITFEPVGSQCITDWAEALPLDVRETVLKAVKGATKTQRAMQAAMRKAKAAAKRQAVIVATLRGDEDEDGAKLMERFLALPEDAEKADALTDIASKVIRFGSFASDPQRSFFGRLVNQAEGSGRQAKAPQASQEPAQDAPVSLVDQALKLLANGAEDAMKPHRASTMRDIAEKGERWGSLSAGQESFLTDLISEAREALGESAPQAVATPVAFDPAEEYDTPF